MRFLAFRGSANYPKFRIIYSHGRSEAPVTEITEKYCAASLMTLSNRRGM